MDANSTVFEPGHGDQFISECGTITVEDWTAIHLPHIAVSIKDDKGGYYVAHFSLDRAKDQDWLYIAAEDRVNRED